MPRSRRPDGPRPFAVRIDGRLHDAQVVAALLTAASEFPGPRPLAVLVGQRMLVLPVSIDPLADGWAETQRRILHAYRRPDQGTT